MSACAINDPNFSRNTWKGNPPSDSVINKLCVFVVCMHRAPHHQPGSAIWDQLLHQAQILMRDSAVESYGCHHFLHDPGLLIGTKEACQGLGECGKEQSAVCRQTFHMLLAASESKLHKYSSQPHEACKIKLIWIENTKLNLLSFSCMSLHFRQKKEKAFICLFIQTCLPPNQNSSK